MPIAGMAHCSRSRGCSWILSGGRQAGIDVSTCERIAARRRQQRGHKPDREEREKADLTDLGPRLGIYLPHALGRHRDRRRDRNRSDALESKVCLGDGCLVWVVDAQLAARNQLQRETNGCLSELEATVGDPPASSAWIQYSVHHSALRALKHGSWSRRVLLRASRFRVQFKLDPSIHPVAGSLRGWVGGAGRCSSYLGTVLIPRNSTFQGSRTNMYNAHVSFNTTLLDMPYQEPRIAFESISLRP